MARLQLEVDKVLVENLAKVKFKYYPMNMNRYYVDNESKEDFAIIMKARDLGLIAMDNMEDYYLTELGKQAVGLIREL
jgi:hypothetical protein